MKIYLFCAMILASGLSYAQNFAMIEHVSAISEDGEVHLSFTVPKEANVCKYVIEAATAKDDFEVIGAILSRGNTTTPKVYEYRCLLLKYARFRIKQIGFDGAVMTKGEVSILTDTPPPSRQIANF